MQDQGLADLRPIASFARLWCYRLIVRDAILRAQKQLEGSHNDCTKENAFTSRLVSHSKGPVHVYFFSSGSIFALAGALDG